MRKWYEADKDCSRESSTKNGRHRCVETPFTDEASEHSVDGRFINAHAIDDLVDDQSIIDAPVTGATDMSLDISQTMSTPDLVASDTDSWWSLPKERRVRTNKFGKVWGTGRRGPSACGS